jgi:hypothetical protein
VSGFLSKYSGVTRIEIDPDGEWWVDVKDNLDRHSAAQAQAVLVRPVVRYNGTDSETRGDVDTGGYQTELVFAHIVNWNLTDEDGLPLPLEPEEERRKSIERLPEKVFMLISRHIQGDTEDSGKKATFPKERVGRRSGIGRPSA